MRYCGIAYTFYDIDNRVRRYAETLARRGDSVDFYALRQEGKPKHEVINGVDVYRIQKRVINEKGELSHLFRLMLFLVKSTLRLSIQTIKKKYDIIHVHSIPDFEVFACGVPKMFGTKIILDIHDLVPEFYSEKFGVGKKGIIQRTLIFIEKLSAQFSDHVIIANHMWENTITKRSVPPEKCTTIINYPDPNIFSSNNKINSINDNEKFIIMYPGSLHYHQGLDIAIKAFSKISGTFPQAELHIYGDGPEKFSLQKLMNNLNLNGKIFFYGYAPMEEIADKMASADIGIVPKRAESFGDEAFSTKTLEFMAIGVPLLISKTKVDRYYFNKDLVVFFHSSDVKDLTEKLVHLLTDQDLRTQLSKNGKIFIAKNNWDVKKYLFLQIIDNLLQQN